MADQPLKGKVGVTFGSYGWSGEAAAVGGNSVGGQELAIRSILDFYVISEMIPSGGGSFGANLGGTFWSKDKGAMGVS